MSNIQFYLKCQNVETGKMVTYRFVSQEILLSFSAQLSTQNLVIIDSHIAFFDAELLFNPFFDNENDKIEAVDINTALDGKNTLDEWVNQV